MLKFFGAESGCRISLWRDTVGRGVLHVVWPRRVRYMVHVGLWLSSRVRGHPYTGGSVSSRVAATTTTLPGNVIGRDHFRADSEAAAETNGHQCGVSGVSPSALGLRRCLLMAPLGFGFVGLVASLVFSFILSVPSLRRLFWRFSGCWCWWSCF